MKPDFSHFPLGLCFSVLGRQLLLTLTSQRIFSQDCTCLGFISKPNSLPVDFCKMRLVSCWPFVPVPLVENATVSQGMATNFSVENRSILALVPFSFWLIYFHIVSIIAACWERLRIESCDSSNLALPKTLLKKLQKRPRESICNAHICLWFCVYPCLVFL